MIIYARNLFFAGLFLTLVSCATTNQNRGRSNRETPANLYESGFALSQQQPPPSNIQSIKLAPQGNSNGAPVIELNSSQKLTLSFDYLGGQSRQFRVSVSHRRQDWQESPITPSTYLDSFSSAYIQNAKSSISNKPPYRHVEYSFPNNSLKPAVSGNYFIEVYDYESGNLLFSMPFFISEEKGNIETNIDRLYASSKNGRPLHQLYSIFEYPSFVEFPQFDLSMSFVQNRFWGRTKTPEFLDTITPGQLQGRLSRDQSYIGNFEFNTLNLGDFNADGQQIVEYQPGSTPPKVILRRDTPNLDLPSQYLPLSSLRKSLDDRSSDYARVQFSLESGNLTNPEDEIYIVGQFNNWMISELNKMTYNYDSQLWTGEALIKQGTYAYKYVVVRNNRIDDLALDQGFLSNRQEYMTFVYFKDPDKNFDRLLKVDVIVRD